MCSLYPWLQSELRIFIYYFCLQIMALFCAIRLLTDAVLQTLYHFALVTIQFFVSYYVTFEIYTGLYSSFFVTKAASNQFKQS